MKYVLKKEQQIKLFTEKLTYEALVTFVEREFEVLGPSIEITFTDEDGDMITIASEDDIAIVQSYFNGKEYVKLNVKGEKKAKTSFCDEININDGKFQPTEPQKKKKKSKSVKNQEKIQKKPQKQKKKENVKKVKQPKSNIKISEIKKLLNLTVVQLVDERLKAMLPCMKEQMSKDIEMKKIDCSQLVHENYGCSLCLQAPIIGIRFQCPICQGFNICSSCEQSNIHEHNLLKIRHINLKVVKKESKHLDKLCKLILKGTQKLQEKKSAKSVKKEQQKKELQKEKIKQMKRYLSQLFGNQTTFYNDFAKKNKQLSIEEAVRQYASNMFVPDEQLQEKVIDLQCCRLEKKFKKQANTYKDFVKANLSFDFDEILSKIYEKGVERKMKKTVSAKEQLKPQEPKQKKQQPPKAEVQQKKEILVDQSKLKAKKEEPELKGAKKEILSLMIQFFGESRRDQFIKFIEANEKYTKEDIVQMWADKCSIIKP